MALPEWQLVLNNLSFQAMQFAYFDFVMIGDYATSIGWAVIYVG
jgi:hypothetical protein